MAEFRTSRTRIVVRVVFGALGLILLIATPWLLMKSPVWLWISIPLLVIWLVWGTIEYFIIVRRSTNQPFKW